MIKRCLLTTLVLVLLCGTPLWAAPLDLKDETTRISYSLGYQIGGDFKTQGVGITPEAVVQGIQDALADATPQISKPEMDKLLIALKQKVVENQKQEIYQSGKAFMAANLKKEGVKELPGGIQYRVLKAGKGPHPRLDDTVDIRFRTSRTDGTVMASNEAAKTPKTYQVQKMLPGLQQALLKMSPGAKWEIFLPPDRRSELTQSGGVLIYELELVAIHPGPGKGS